MPPEVGTPVGDHALLADGLTAALVDREGSIVWWCPGRFDAPSVFGRLLDADGGHWSIRPVGAFGCRRRYLDDTFVLETRFESDDAELIVTDALAMDGAARGHQIGLAAPGEIVRLVECVRGSVEVEVEVEPRFDYGRSAAHVTSGVHGVTFATSTARLHLATDHPLGDPDHRPGGVLRTAFRLEGGERRSFRLGPHPGGEPAVGATIDDTAEGWRSWAFEHGYDGWQAAAVRRSALVLQALTYGPSGAVVAAPTTSLPEIVGGTSNWDYRYAWVRDASITLRALWVGACPDEADRYFAWMARAAGATDGTPVLYRVDGGDDLAESTLAHWSGWRASRPVRIGNEASRQTQLDVPGHILDAALLLGDQLDPDRRTRRFLVGLAELAMTRWRETDSGIWEGREGERHYTSSKVMCWVALDRAARMARQLRAGRKARRWRREADLIRETILEQAWHPDVGAFTGAFGSDHLDASVLLMATMGMLPAGDERMAATIDVIERELGRDGLIRRWTGAEDEPFVMCSCWLAECRALAGDVEGATAIFDEVLARANDLGLLAEEIDLETRELLGNFPQALSHAALITAAYAIDVARRSS